MDYTKITKNQLKFTQSLKLKKYRQKYNKFTIEGEKIVLELLRTNYDLIVNIIVTQDLLDKNTVLHRLKSKVLLANSKQMDMLSQFKNSSSIIAVCTMDESFLIANTPSKGKFLYLENIQDPGNAGTIFRTADWFGFDGIYLSDNSVDIWNHKVVQSSMGSVFRIPHRYLSKEEFTKIPLFKIATTLQGKELAQFEPRQDFMLCFGNEGQGLEQSTINQCDENLLISHKKSLGAESLNIAISAGIFMHSLSK